jgi:hypothetical protein
MQAFLDDFSRNWLKNSPVILWMTPEYSSGGTGRTTTHRMLEFDRNYHHQLQEIGISVIDLLTITQAMLEASLDGVHFYKHSFRGHVAAVVGNIVVHELFESLKAR